MLRSPLLYTLGAVSLVLVLVAEPVTAPLGLGAQETLAQRFNPQQAEKTSPKDQRNAQNLSSVCSAASAAGHDFTRGAEDAEAVAKRVILGAVIGAGTFKGEFFGIPNMSDDDLAGALRHLELANGVLSYQVKPKPHVDGVRLTEGMLKAQEIVIQCTKFQLQEVHDFVGSHPKPEAVLDAMIAGTETPFGSYALALSNTERQAVLPHLVVENGVLKYRHRDQVEDATPWLAAAIAEATERRALRNAEKLLSTCEMASDAGHDFIGKDTDLKAVIARIVKGTTFADGAFAGLFFGAPDLTERHQQEAATYLKLEDGRLRRDHTPAVEPLSPKQRTATAAISEDASD